MSRPGGVCVYSERRDVALELLAPGRSLATQAGCRLTAIWLGPEAQETARELIRCGAERVILADPPLPHTYHGDVETAALKQLLEREEPLALLVGGTVRGTEVAAAVAQALGVGCVSGCEDVRFEDGTLVADRRSYGRFLATQRIASQPGIATMPPRRFDPPAGDDGRAGALEAMALDLPAPRVRIVADEARERSLVRIDRVKVIVAAGRGVRKPEDLGILRELADLLAGTLAGTRPLTDDLGWLPTDVKVGLTGGTVSPELYIACGISGQIEHVVAIRDARVIIAINNDPGAPILEEADYHVIGDLYEIVPALTAVLRESLA